SILIHDVCRGKLKSKQHFIRFESRIEFNQLGLFSASDIISGRRLLLVPLGQSQPCRRRLLRQRLRLQFPYSRIVPMNRQRLVRLRNRVAQVARTIRRPPCIRRHTELPLPFGLPRRRRLLRQRVRFQLLHSGIVPMNRQRLVRLHNRDGQVAHMIRRPRYIRRLTELPLPFDLLRRRRLLRQRVRFQFLHSRIVPVNRQRLVRLRNGVGQVARAIRHPPCIRGHTKLPFPFYFSFRATL